MRMHLSFGLFVAVLILLVNAAALCAQSQWEAVGGTATGSWDVRALAADRAGKIYAGTFGQGVWRSADGTNWQALNDGLSSPSLQITKMILTPDGQTLFAAAINRGELNRYRLATDNAWERISNSFRQDMPVSNMAADAEGRIYTTMGEYNIGSPYFYRSQDNGTSWTTYSQDNPDYFTIICVTSSGALIADCGQLDVESLRRSTDGGKTWQETQLNYSYGWPDHALPQSFGMNVNAGSIFAGFLDGGQGMNLARSSDQGINWVDLFHVGPLVSHPTDQGIPPMSYTVTAIASRPVGDLFVSLDGGGVWRSTDDGQSWTDVSQGLGNMNVHTLIVTPDGALYAGTDAGLYRSTGYVPVRLTEFSLE